MEMAAIVTVEQPGALAFPAELVASARSYAAASKAPRTVQAYRAAWETFRAWCYERALLSLPASSETVALYLSDRASSGRRVASLDLDLAAISQAHRAAGFPSPRGGAAVQAVRQGIRRTHGVAQRQAAPLLPSELRAISSALPASILGLRDRALLLLGFASASRRSELVALQVEDLRFTTEGIELSIRRSKTDQEGAGAKKAIPYGSDPATCPVRVVRAWIETAGLHSGPVFREVNRHGRVSGLALSAQSVARVVKRACTAVSLDPSRYSGHSLRSGLATAAAKAGKSERAIMRQTGHRSVAMVRRYIRDADLWAENAATGIGL